ncbi:MAG: glycosyltransferase family 4 protein [Anaerolineae bacterium]
MSGSCAEPAGVGEVRSLVIGVNGWFWGQEAVGSGQYLHQLLVHLASLYPKDRYILFVPAGAPAASLPLPADNVEYAELRTPFGARGDLAKLWFEQVSVPAACRRWKVDLLHVPYWAAPAWAPVPVVTTIHDVIPLILPEYAGSPAARAYTWLVRRTARRSRLVLADSQTSARDVVRRLGLPAGRVRAVYLGVPQGLAPAHDPSVLARVRERCGLPERYMLYLGGFDRRKNVPMLLQAYARAVRQCPELPALVVGGRLPEKETPLFPDPRRAAVEAGVQERVRFIGWVREKDKPALYSMACCFLFPSLYEGFGLPVLEAMACGAPVVAARGSSLEEIVGPAGILLEPAEPDAWAEAMCRLCREPALAQELSARAREQASGFSWEHTAQETRRAFADADRERVFGEEEMGA